jgi:hypothetical protein
MRRRWEYFSGEELGYLHAHLTEEHVSSKCEAQLLSEIEHEIYLRSRDARYTIRLRRAGKKP